MLSWSQLSALGGLDVTTLLAFAIAVWLGAAHCWRLALAWCLLFGAALLVAGVTQMAFLGWGIGVQAWDFTGFSGHATRAAAVFPVALFLLLGRRGQRKADMQPAGSPERRQGGRLRAAVGVAVCAGCLLAAGVAVARVKVGAHSPSEAVAGCLLGLLTAGLFMARARAARDHSPKPLLLGLLAATILLPRADPIDGHQWLTAAAIKLAGHDRVYLRRDWQPAPWPYVPPCDATRVRFDYLCL